MSYTPGLNGGRINATIGGNTAGAGSLVSTGTVTLAGGNNITLSQNGNAITVSGMAPTVAVSGNITFGTLNTISSNEARFYFNNLAVSQSSNTITVSGPSLYALSAGMSGGNTAGDGNSLANKSLYLAGGNNITLSNATGTDALFGAWQTVSISGPNMFRGGVSNIGNSVGTSGTASNQIVFAGGNNVTLSQSTGAGGNTISVSAANQSVQTQNLMTVNATQGAVSISGGNNITVGNNASTITISAANQTAQTQNLHNVTLGGNTAGVMAQVSSGTMTLAGGNNVTLSQNGNAVTISAGGGGAGVVLSGSNNSITSGTASFVNANGVSWSFNGQSISGSVNTSYLGSNASSNYVQANAVFNGTNANGTIASNAISVSVPAQTNQTVGLYAASNTTQSTSATVDARSLSFAGAGIASVGATNGSVVISVPSGGGAAFSEGISNIGNTAGTSGTVSNQMIWAGGNNITLSQSTGAGGNTISISALAMFDAGVSNIGNTLGNTGSNSNGLVLAGGNNITLSQSTDAGGATVTISGAAGGGGATLSSFEPWPIHNTGTSAMSANTNSSGAMTIIPMTVTPYLAAGSLQVIQSFSFISGGTSSFNQTATQNYGIYTRGTGASSTTLSQITSGSWSYQVSYNNSSITFSSPNSTGSNGYTYTSTGSAGVNVSSGFTGLKLIQFPISSVMTPGVYWLGLFDRNSSSSFNSGMRQSYYGNGMTLTGLAPLGSFSSAFTSGTNLVGGLGNWMPGFGSFTSAGQTNLPNTVALSAITQNAAFIPYVKFVNT